LGQLSDIISFHVSLTVAGFLRIRILYYDYGVTSIPAAFLVKRFSEPLMIVAFVAGKLGSLSFAVFPEHRVVVVSLFVT
jgi:hypothetical protein